MQQQTPQPEIKETQQQPAGSGEEDKPQQQTTINGMTLQEHTVKQYMDSINKQQQMGGQQQIGGQQ